MAPSRRCIYSLLISLLYLSSACSAAEYDCNTQANPHCAGDSRFDSICCPSPNVCYFQDRLGTPGCCAAGSNCNNAQVEPQQPAATCAGGYNCNSPQDSSYYVVATCAAGHDCNTPQHTSYYPVATCGAGYTCNNPQDNPQQTVVTCVAGNNCNNPQDNPQQPAVTIIVNSAVSVVPGLGPIAASMKILTASGLSLTTPATALSTLGSSSIGAAWPIAWMKHATPIWLPIVVAAWHTIQA